MLKGGKKIIGKLEERCRALESELDSEQRRFQVDIKTKNILLIHNLQDASKNVTKHERRCRELSFQVDEDKQNFARLQDLIDKLQQKLKAQVGRR